MLPESDFGFETNLTRKLPAPQMEKREMTVQTQREVKPACS